MYLKMIQKQEQLKTQLCQVCIHVNFNKKDGAYQIKHAAQHGQKQEGSLSADIVDGANYRCTGGWHSEDEGPDRVQVKLRGQALKRKIQTTYTQKSRCIK